LEYHIVACAGMHRVLSNNEIFSSIR